jgi:hypothetical protein
LRFERVSDPPATRSPQDVYQGFTQLLEELDYDNPPPTPTIHAYVEALLERWPDIDEAEDSPWSTSPLIGEAIGSFVYFPMVWQRPAQARTSPDQQETGASGDVESQRELGRRANLFDQPHQGLTQVRDGRLWRLLRDVWDGDALVLQCEGEGE